jgi:hypothetical protein
MVQRLGGAWRAGSEDVVADGCGVGVTVAGEGGVEPADDEGELLEDGAELPVEDDGGGEEELEPPDTLADPLAGAACEDEVDER